MSRSRKTSDFLIYQESQRNWYQDSGQAEMLVQGKIWALYIHKEINGRRLEKYSFVAQIMVDGTMRIAIYH